MLSFRVYLILVLLAMAFSACAGKQVLKDAKCQLDKSASEVVCRVPIPQEAIK